MIAIKVENLSKKYIISHQKRERYTALRDVLARKAKEIFSSRKSPQITTEDFYALKDVSFEVQCGDRIGIIGRNGAGKSTLLKILSRITEPTKGRVTLNGRVASLLEVGTGFHPELTGRENIFLNGAILGMSKAEIKRKFDEIVAFAETEKFLDTPVKYYSSGMYVRLAFAVAAHLEPEILVVDEVLAVGDAQFQKKCMNKMGSVAQEGRTVLFVSHNIGAIRKLCNKAVLLKNGKLQAQGEVSEVVNRYICDIENTGMETDFAAIIARLPHEPAFKFTGIEVEKHDAGPGMRFIYTKDINIALKYEVMEAKSKLFVVLEILDSEGNVLVESFHNPRDLNPVPKGAYVSRAVLPGGFLLPRVYEVRIYAGIFGERDFFRPPVSFVMETVHDGAADMVYDTRPLQGRFVLPVKWDNVKL